ncbi:hypothetical protein PVAP13_6KG013900 [Panicum virgatum]|uniref:Uncharacterized protein n=1 Tax=Panicum virgatum TaxID=38727 RepID=A0A8T0R7Q9_PANVG|nr:hypothetical protein PVAP13_6KG013900 [Panicum virgatum]
MLMRATVSCASVPGPRLASACSCSLRGGAGGRRAPCREGCGRPPGSGRAGCGRTATSVLGGCGRPPALRRAPRRAGRGARCEPPAGLRAPAGRGAGLLADGDLHAGRGAAGLRAPALRRAPRRAGRVRAASAGRDAGAPSRHRTGLGRQAAAAARELTGEVWVRVGIGFLGLYSHGC